jgi:uncharacterized membrane protein YdjX (TVP38/TMEM64 family)
VKDHTKAILKLIILITFLVGGIILLFNPLKEIFSSLDGIKESVNNVGAWAPLIFIALVALQVLLAPIPGQAAGFAGGYVFGVFFGILYSMIGLIIGSFLAFLLARKLGRHFVERVVKKETLEKFDNLVMKRGVFTLFLIYLLPFFPDDAICYIAGLTKIKIRTLVIISTLGRLPGFVILSLIGAGFSSGNSIFSVILLGAVLIFSIVVYLNKSFLERIMLRIVRKIKSKKEI